MRRDKDNMGLGLAGERPMQTKSSPAHSRLDERGYVLVALLVAMAVSAIWMTALIPAWRQQAQREKEADLIFRLLQYGCAVKKYVAKNGVLPQNADQLVQGHFLRKKWKDPITGKDFLGEMGVQNNVPGISGFRSASNATSIKIFMQQQEYDLWVGNPQTCNNDLQTRGVPIGPAPQGNNPAGPGRNTPGGPGGPGGPGNTGPPRGGGPNGPGTTAPPRGGGGPGGGPGGVTPPPRGGRGM